MSNTEKNATDQKKLQAKHKVKYPLIDWKINEKQALKICYDAGYTWGGLYEYFNRVSCFCCPLQPLNELRMLRKHFPELWKYMLELEDKFMEYNRGFREYKTVHDMEQRFANEDLQQHFNF